MVPISSFRPYSRRAQSHFEADLDLLDGVEFIVGVVKRLRKVAARCPALQHCPNGIS